MKKETMWRNHQPSIHFLINIVKFNKLLHNAPLNTSVKFPYLLPQNHHFTDLAVYNAHESLFHNGVNYTTKSLVVAAEGKYGGTKELKIEGGRKTR
jgi:hypothetical protein